jgi:hypothetical protein
VSIAAPRLGRLALRCWLIATGLFVLSVVVGIVASALGPGDDSVQTWAPLIFPAVVGLAGVPVLIAAVVLAIRSLVVEKANARAIVALLLSLLSLAPAVIIGLATLESRL